MFKEPYFFGSLRSIAILMNAMNATAIPTKKSVVIDILKFVSNTSSSLLQFLKLLNIAASSNAVKNSPTTTTVKQKTGE